uniref:Uncharacterized protein n=1 Tax=Picea glauca TaxID=3330 RepID=A0A101LYA5_PICGL|nr:hypothetical protein ABT39_MTgene5708 [Picea glauca]
MLPFRQKMQTRPQRKLRKNLSPVLQKKMSFLFI